MGSHLISLAIFFAPLALAADATADRLQAIFARLLAAASDISPRLVEKGHPAFGPAPTLQLASRVGQVNYLAWAVPGAILMTRGILELHTDDEMAFLLGHELGHVYQYHAGTPEKPRYILAPENLEHDADAWGFLLSVKAGYDAYAAGAFLGKQAFALGQASLAHQQWLETHDTTGHRSFNTRLTELLILAHRACRETESLPARLLDLDCAARRDARTPNLSGLPL